MSERLPPAHPVPQLGELLGARARADTTALLAADAQLSLCFNARGALFEVACELGRDADNDARREVLVPGFHCPSGITPLERGGLRPVFYRIGPDLRLDHADLLAKVGPQTRAVVVIHFFGFAHDLTPLQGLRERGVAIIEDWSHSFLQTQAQGLPVSLPAWQGDYQVFSFWKLAPCGIGGGLRRAAPAGRTRARGWTRPASPWRERVVRFKRELEEALAHGPHRRLDAAFQAVESWRLRGLRGQPAPAAAPGQAGAAVEDLPAGESRYPFDPLLAQAGLHGQARRRLLATDLAALAHTRRRHFQTYAERLPRTAWLQALHPQLDTQTVPWVYPVRLRERDRIDRGWRAAGVALHTFGIWLHSGLAQADAATRRDAQTLASELLCLSVHQGLGDADIARGVEVITRHVEGASA